jgi:ankyrin repeat protein
MSTPPNSFITITDELLLESIENDSEYSEIESIIYGDNYLNINVQNILQETVLHIAVRKNQIKTVELLLSNKNTRPNIQNVYGDTPLHIAIRNGNIHIAKALLEDWRVNHSICNKNKETVLHLIFSKHHPELYVLVQKQDLTNRDILGYTPFMYAVLQFYQRKDYKYVEIIHSLLDNGALVEIPDILDDIGDIWKSFINHPLFDIHSDIKDNVSLFDYSCYSGDKELLLNLIDRKTVIVSEKIILYRYEKNIQYAFRKGYIEICSILLTIDLKHNKEMSILNKQLFFLNCLDELDLITIMEILLDTNRITVCEIVKFSLLYYKTNVFKKFITKETIDTVHINTESILVICCIIYPELFNYMLDHYEIPNNIIDKKNNTLLNIAVQQSFYSKHNIKKLVQMGYDPNYKNDSGKKPLDYAMIYNSTEFINILLPITSITFDERISILNKYSSIPYNILIQVLDIDWSEMIKIISVGVYQNLLNFISDSNDDFKKTVLFYIIGKNNYTRYIEVLVQLKNISIKNSHNTLDIWTLESMEDQDIIQYGTPINGKYKTLTLQSILELVRQTEEYVSLGYIKDPYDRSSLNEQISYPNGYPFFIEVLIRKLTE